MWETILFSLHGFKARKRVFKKKAPPQSCPYQAKSMSTAIWGSRKDRRKWGWRSVAVEVIRGAESWLPLVQSPRLTAIEQGALCLEVCFELWGSRWTQTSPTWKQVSGCWKAQWQNHYREEDASWGKLHPVIALIAEAAVGLPMVWLLSRMLIHTGLLGLSRAMSISPLHLLPYPIPTCYLDDIVRNLCLSFVPTPHPQHPVAF